ncbi:jg24545 [Pararge aegeria aegeria]|uniref:Jg24545 protein n=1 Tax=Pararge aegeria aegeria TaxID=348720 RepID=A0A8S4SRX4_9NEOP|nr:jg24545 [Pararge aegeria aegeria]
MTKIFNNERYHLGKMEAGRAFQILAVQFRNEDVKRFVRVRGISARDEMQILRAGTASRFDGKKVRGGTRS